MTQRIKKIIYKRPTVSMGNSTDAILPGGPFQPDFFFRRDIVLIQAPYVPPPPVSYTLWEWNGQDISQFDFDNMVLVSSSTSTPANIPSASISVESMSLLSNEQNQITTAQHYPPSDNADSGSVLKFHIFSGTRGGFFVPLVDFNPANIGQFTIELTILSRSFNPHGGPLYPDSMEFSVVVGEIIDGKLNAIGQNFSYNNQSVGFAKTNKNEHGYSQTLIQQLNRYYNSYVSMNFEMIPTGSKNKQTTIMKAGYTSYANNGNSLWLTGKLNEVITSPYSSTNSFFSSGFNPQKLGFIFWTSNGYNSSYDLFIKNIRVVKALDSRISYGSEFVPSPQGALSVLTQSFGPISGTILTAGTPQARFFKWSHPPLQPYTQNYQWRRNGSPITNATSSVYKIANEDINQSIEVFAILSNSVGSAIQSSSTILPIEGLPSISGSSRFSYFGTAENLSSSGGRIALLYDSMTPSGSRTFVQNTAGSRPYLTSSFGKQWMRTWLGSGSTGFFLQGSSNLSSFISSSAYHAYAVFNVSSASLNNGSAWTNHFVIADTNGYWGIFVRKQAENDYWAYAYHYDTGVKTIQFPINLNETYCMETSFMSGVFSARINSSSYQSSSSIGNLGTVGVIVQIGNQTYPLYGMVGAVALVGNKFDAEESQMYMEALSRSWGFNL